MDRVCSEPKDDALQMLKMLGNPFVELRAIAPESSGLPRIQSGYFDDLEKAAEAAVAFSDDNPGYQGVYVTINELDGTLGAGARGRLAPSAKTTRDARIARRKTLFVDLDPVRAGGISGPATDSEHDAARQKAEEIKAWASSTGWPEPLMMDSGNGAYLIYRIDLPNDEPSKLLCKHVLAALAEEFDCEACTVDRSVSNAARIMRVAGTWNRKPGATDDRIHRRAGILCAPAGDCLTCVSREQLEAVTGLGTSASVEEKPRQYAKREPLSPQAFADLKQLVRNYLTYVGETFTERPKDNYVVLDLVGCTRNGFHEDGNPGVLVYHDGGIGYQCFHSKCNKEGWKGFQEHLVQERKVVKFVDYAKHHLDEVLTNESGRKAMDSDYLAKVHLSKLEKVNGKPPIVHFHENTYYYKPDEGWLRATATTLETDIRVSVAEVYRRLYELQKAAFGVSSIKPVSSHQVRETYAAIQSQCKLTIASDVTPPFWIEDDPWSAGDLLVFRNGILNVRLYVEGKPIRDCFRERTPKLFCQTRCDFDFPVVATEPSEWLAFLASLEQSPEWIAALQESMGYMLWQAYDLHKFFYFIGVPRSGKGVIDRTIQALVGGPAACHTVQLNELPKFGLQGARGKRLLRVSEAVITGKDTRAEVSMLKAITGGDEIALNLKHEPNTSIRLNVKVLMTSNELIEGLDNSGALAVRMIPLVFTKSFVGREDADLEKRLVPEYPAIVHWALEGLRRLYENGGKFTMPASSVKQLEAFNEKIAPVNKFVQEACVFRPGRAIQPTALRSAFESWCIDADLAEAKLSDKAFKEQFGIAAPGVMKKRMPQRDYVKQDTPWDNKDAERPWVYCGIELKAEWLEEQQTSSHSQRKAVTVKPGDSVGDAGTVSQEVSFALAP
ncbi:MAG: hypothetical protein K1X74_19800 [Pirellulales bacterium]|nr:hypothetical protein [Pirellulales bacterium]